MGKVDAASFGYSRATYPISNPSMIKDLAHMYHGCMKFYGRSAQRDEQFDSNIEDLIQRARNDAYDLASATVQRIRDLDEPHNVDGIAACLNFMERTGADAQSIERECTSLADARECRRVEMGFVPFCAATYFKKAREFGDEPYARLHDGGIAIGGSVNGRAEGGHNRAWAIYEDPDMDLRAEYARSVLESLPASDRSFPIVHLGV